MPESLHNSVSAPGKMMLLGEYAVLTGAPCVVMAIDRRARVEVQSAIRNVLTAPQLFSGEQEFSIDGQGKVSWNDTDDSKLTLINEIISRYRHKHPLSIRTDTAAFFENGRKMGFGSSAALCVAAATALNETVPSVDELIEIHRTAQGGRGSGFDIVAACFGGVIQFSNDPVQIEPLTMPAGLQLRCVWTGQSVSTAAMVKTLDDHSAALDELAQNARAAAASLGATADSWVTAVDLYAGALQQFAAQTGIGIFSGGHQPLVAIAKNSGVAYKPSGAGGGDIGVALSTDSVAMQSFTDAVHHAGMRVMGLQIAVDGVRFG